MKKGDGFTLTLGNQPLNLRVNSISKKFVEFDLLDYPDNAMRIRIIKDVAKKLLGDANVQSKTQE
jgi:hypothetical protein